MAASTTTSFPVAMSTTTAGNLREGLNRRRRIGPEAGHALEKLGHAIEYLADEFVHEGGVSLSANEPQIEAIQLLMALNRQIYFACPEIPTFRDRIISLLHR
jgi:hypothetical protein